MALTPCRECGGQVSTEAAFCPHCGAAQKVASQPGENFFNRNRGCGDLLIWPVLIVALLIVGRLACA